MKNIASKFSLLILLLFSAVAARAQTEPCKAKLRANRKKTVSLDKLQQQSQSWASYTGDAFTRIPATEYDTISVCRPAGGCSVFKARGPVVRSSLITYWDRMGEEWTDSLNLDLIGAGRGGRVYFNTYNSRQVVMTLNKKRRTRRYYKAAGGDSLYRVFYENGLTDTIKWYGRYGNDSLTEVFTPAQVLTWRKTMQQPGEYQTEEYKDGRLALVLFDTLVRQWPVQGRKEYYSNGALRSVTYYKGEEPVLTWSYYREDGSLVKRIRKAAVLQTNQHGVAVIDPPAEYIFTTVEQLPEYPGGDAFFKRSSPPCCRQPSAAHNSH